jgi:hypothetical protein
MASHDTEHAIIATAAAGSLSRKGLGLSDEEAKQLDGELGGGRAAVLVMCSEADVKTIADYLALEGGRAVSHPIDATALEDDSPPGG